MHSFTSPKISRYSYSCVYEHAYIEASRVCVCVCVGGRACGVCVVWCVHIINNDDK